MGGGAAINWSVSRTGQRCDYFHDVSIQIKRIVKRFLIVRPLQFAAIFYHPAFHHASVNTHPPPLHVTINNPDDI